MKIKKGKIDIALRDIIDKDKNVTENSIKFGTKLKAQKFIYNQRATILYSNFLKLNP